ncbi:MAG: sensor histidine kinase, partial [Bdellovibrionota bacterium]
MRRQLKDQPLPIQFLVAGGIVAVFSIVSLILLLVQVSRQEQASRWLGHSHRTVGRLSTLGTDYYRQRTLLLDYLKSLDEKQLANLHERRQLWTEGFQATQALVSDDTEQVEYLGHLAASYDTWIKLSDELLSRAKKGQPIPFEKLRTESGDFKEAFLIIDAMINAQNSLLNRRDHQQRDAISTTFTAIAAINIALLLIFGVVLTRLYFQIARPIAELSRGMARYQGGDFTARVRVSNRSEIGFLEAAFNEMAEKIEGMVGDLRKLDELKTEFLSTVSHELRTPLTSIGGYVKLLAAGDAGPVTGTQKEFLDIVDTNVVRLTHLINDILDVEKMESGKIQLIKEPQDLGSILKEVRDTFGIVAQQKGLELRYSVPERLVPIQGDRMRLVQLFMNLVSNAIKYTKHGFVSMEVEEHDFAIVVRIRDSGVGLTADEQEKLFQKFYRARSGLKSGEGGTGLGLVIVRGLVESHGGTIRVESDVGVGTTFTVSFPVAQNVMRSAPATRAEGLLPLLPPIPIWIVDQSASDSERLRTL